MGGHYDAASGSAFVGCATGAYSTAAGSTELRKVEYIQGQGEMVE